MPPKVEPKQPAQTDAKTRREWVIYIEQRIQKNMNDITKAVGEAVPQIVERQLAKMQEELKHEVMRELMQVLGPVGN